MAARFIRIAIKDRLQVNALQSTEQQRDDGDRLDHTKPHSGLIPHVSLPDREKVCIAATSSVKFFNKLYLYQCPTYGTGLCVIEVPTGGTRSREPPWGLVDPPGSYSLFTSVKYPPTGVAPFVSLGTLDSECNFGSSSHRGPPYSHNRHYRF